MMLWNVSEGLAQDKARLNFTKEHSKNKACMLERMLKRRKRNQGGTGKARLRRDVPP
ncbi:hypothetical protein B0G71_6437 [Paraburkholderia sp. BL27I4N3]|nr:hypothetical protein B0G71_6437 [Paraburkholderia sp. BL27I4N3]